MYFVWKSHRQLFALACMLGTPCRLVVCGVCECVFACVCVGATLQTLLRPEVSLLLLLFFQALVV